MGAQPLLNHDSAAAATGAANPPPSLVPTVAGSLRQPLGGSAPVGVEAAHGGAPGGACRRSRGAGRGAGCGGARRRRHPHPVPQRSRPCGGYSAVAGRQARVRTVCAFALAAWQQQRCGLALPGLAIRVRCPSTRLPALLLRLPCSHADCVRELLEAGASPLPANTQGATALHYAAARGQAACARLLLSAPVRLPGGWRRGGDAQASPPPATPAPAAAPPQCVAMDGSQTRPPSLPHGCLPVSRWQPLPRRRRAGAGCDRCRAVSRVPLQLLLLLPQPCCASPGAAGLPARGCSTSACWAAHVGLDSN